MNKKITKIVMSIGLSIAFLVACEKPNPPEEKSKLDIPQNIVIKIEENKNEYFTIESATLNNIHLEVPGDIRGFSKERSLLIYSSLNSDNLKTTLTSTDGIENKDIEIDGVVENLLINNDGTKVLYKSILNNGYVEYNYLDVLTNTVSMLNDNVVISGDLVKFIDNNNIILYGVDIENKKSGIFRVNIESNEFELIHQISNAFIEYIQVLDDNNIMFIEASMEGEKDTYIYDLSNNKLNLVTSEIKMIKELILKDHVMYFIGELIDSRLSLYSLNIMNGEIKRLVYDFPKQVIENSSLIYENDKLFFVGYENDEYNSNIYTYDIINKSIRVLDEEDGEYVIIKESR